MLDDLRNFDSDNAASTGLSSGYEIKIGIEIEFMVLDAMTKKPIEKNLESNLTSLVPFLEDLEEIHGIMSKHGISFECSHKECGNGQYEIVLGYGEVLKTLDDYYLTKEIIS